MKTALVTGAARGIGLATTHRLLKAGYQVAMVDKDRDALHAAAKGLTGVTTFTTDVSVPEQVADLAAALADQWPQPMTVLDIPKTSVFGTSDFHIQNVKASRGERQERVHCTYVSSR